MIEVIVSNHIVIKAQDHYTLFEQQNLVVSPCILYLQVPDGEMHFLMSIDEEANH